MRKPGCLFAACLLFAMSAPTQYADPASGRTAAQIRHLHEQVYREQAKQRLDSLKTDTNHLAQLSQELKAYVDNVNPDATMSMDIIKKADRIAKLAKQVSQKMKGQ